MNRRHDARERGGGCPAAGGRLPAGWRSIALGLCAASVLAAEPARVPQVTNSLVWPAPPAEPRVAYLRSYQGPSDWGIKDSLWSRIVRFVVGRNKAGETLVRPFGIALDEDDNLCLADSGAATVSYFDRRRKIYQRWSSIEGVRFALPVAIAKAAGAFYVADSSVGKIIAFDIHGTRLFAISENLERPAGLAIIDGKLYVADAAAHRVAVFDLKGRHLFSFGTRGKGKGEFDFPTHLAAAPNGRLLVTDAANSRVQVFDRNGRFEAIIGRAGDGSGCFGRPKGVAADRWGHVYVVDALYDNIQVFDLEGRILMEWGSGGSKPGEFWMPAGIAITRDDEILVADSYNRRVQVFKYIGKQ